MIPPLSNRRVERGYDADRYGRRGWVGPLIGRLKAFRRAATRYDKVARDFPGFVHPARIMDLLR